MRTPTCKTCRNNTIQADAGILKPILYWYCRTCRFEVDDYGFEVKPPSDNGLEELEGYLSGELGRFDNHEYVVKVYDPFLKRNRFVSKKDLEASRSSPVEEEEEDYAYSFSHSFFLPESF